MDHLRQLVRAYEARHPNHYTVRIDPRPPPLRRVWLKRLIRLLLHATPLSLVDRLLGLLFGALRGLVLLLALAVVVGLTPLAKSPAWQQSRGAAGLIAVLHGLLPLLPPQLAQHLPRA